MNTKQISELLALAATQHSALSVGQAYSLGISPDQLDAAVRSGWLTRSRRGVLEVSGASPDMLRPLMAALLAAGPRSVISHASAAVAQRFIGIVAPVIELTAPAQRRIRLDGVRAHRTTTLRRSDVHEVEGLRVTNPVRTIIDLAPRLGSYLLGEILDEGSIARLWTPDQVAARYAQLPPGQPASALPDLLELRRGEGTLRSRLEQRVHRVLEPVVTPFRTNHTEVLDGIAIEMDLAWRNDKIDGEVDGFKERSASRTKFLRQSRRENILAKHNWRIVHFIYEMSDQEIIDQVAPLLSTPANS